MSRPPESSFQHTFRTTVQRADASHSWVAGYNIPPTGFFPYPGAPQFSVAGPPSPPYSYTYRRNCGEWNASNASASAPSTAPPAMSAIASAPDNAFHRWQSAQMPHQSHTQLHNSVSSQVQRAPSRDSLSSSPCQCPSQSLPQQSPSPVSPSDSTTPSFLKPLLTALNALQTQLSCVQTDVQAAASEIRSVRNAQKRMCECISVLEGVFGVCTKKAGTKGKGRAKGKTRGRGRGKNSEVELELEPEVEEPQAEPLNACAIPDRLAAIEFAVEELLDRAGYAPSKTLLRDAATSPPPQPLVSPVLPTSTLEAGLLQKELSLQTATAHSDPREPHSPSLASFTQSLTSMSSPSSAAAPLSLPAAFEKHYADASVDACSPPSPQSECTMTSCRGGLGPGFAPVDWTSVP
ncbi:hypothetical protein F5I97DRAFT_1060028 [Phlebopus sp. FC_14]|nr:hypothetical protein F5I97DRAFT_1060028 [Phlebopus sp. FC_14]